MEEATNDSIHDEEQNIDDPDKTDDEQDEQHGNSLLEENDNMNEETEAAEVDQEDESALLDHEVEDQQEQANDSSLMEESGAAGDAVNESESRTDEANESKTKSKTKSETGEEHDGFDDEEEEEEEDVKNRDANEMPQVDVTTLAKRRWQVKVYPLKPEDFSNGQISRVFSNARESLLYILSSGKYSGGKGEMYVSSGGQASRVVQNLMKLDFKSPNINIEIIKKNSEGAVEEKAFMRFDAKLVRILCVPALPNRRMGSKRERIIGSVFVKNLPIGTSKDMLRVMFPFAPEINFNPEKFHDGTARLVLSTRSAVAPCLRAFAKVELGDSALELRPLQRKGKSEQSESESSKKDEGKEKSESETKEENGEDSQKRESSTRESKSATKKSAAASKTTEGKDKEVKDQKSSSTRTPTNNRRARDQSGNRRWVDRRTDSGLNNARNRFRGTNLGLRVDSRNRFRSGPGFGIRNRSDDRRMRPGLPGASGDVATTETTKEMIILQSQLSMAIKNQLSMLNQTQFALEQAKRGAVNLNLQREAAQPTSSALFGNRGSDRYGMSQLQSDHARRGQMKGGNRRNQQNRRGVNRARDKRQDTEHLVSLAGAVDYGYKRNANLAGLQQDYGASAFGKRRNTGLAARNESQGWGAEDASAWAQQQAHYGYEQEVDDREAEYRSMHAGMNQSAGYGSSDYGYRRY
jgi:hypothetical protein